MNLSIIIPVYNVEQYIEDCLESVIASKLDCEVIMIEDGSDDNSKDICEEYVEKYDNFHLFVNIGKGLADARNTGLEKANGDYIWFVDSDDLIYGNIVEEIGSVINQYQPDIIAFDAVAFNETDINWNLNYYDRKSKIKDSGIISGKDFFKKYYLSDAYRDSACLNICKKDFLDKNKIRFKSGILCEDIAFTFEVYIMAEEMKYVPQCFYKRRYRNGSITTIGNNEEKIISFFHVLQCNTDLMKNIDPGEKLRYVFRQYLFNYYSVQIDRIVQSDVTDKEKYLTKVFDLFFQECNCLAQKGIDLSGVNMILTYMNKIEKLVANETLENKIYEFGNSLYSWKKLHAKMISLRRSLIIEVLKTLPFNKEVNVGIYGIGKHTERLLKEYREYIGEIKANLIFFDSNIQSHTVTYEKKDVLNVQDAANMNLETVIISSCRYQDELYHKISEMNLSINIVRLYTRAEDTFDYFL